MAFNRYVCGSALAGLLAVASSQAVAQRSGPFADLAGSWVGGGHIVTSQGREAIRCRATYTVDGAGDRVRQDLVCASASYRFNVDSTVVSQGGRVSGRWSETTRQIGGDIEGTQRGGRLQARVQGANFAASISLVISGRSQAVTITPQGSGEIREVTVRLQARGAASN